MSPKSDVVEFTILGQKFRLRAGGGEADRVKRVAADVTKRLRRAKGSGASGDLRVALMVAYELAYDLDAAPTPAKAKAQQAGSAEAAKILDRLIDRIDREVSRSKK